MTTEDIRDLYREGHNTDQDMHTAFAAGINQNTRLKLINFIYFFNDTLTESPCFALAEGVCGAVKKEVFKDDERYMGFI